MTSLWKRASTIVALTAAATLGLTACSGDGAPATTGSETAVSNEALTIDNFSERLSKAQLAAGSVHNEISTSVMGQAQTMSGDTIISDKVEDIRMTMISDIPGTDTSMEMRLVDGTMYMNLGALSQDKFVATSLEELGGEELSALMQQSNPQQQMETLTAAVKDFSAGEGTEKIDGVDTRAYTLTVDTKTLLKDQADLLAAAGSQIPETVEYVMHIGSDDLPRRFVMTMGEIVTETNFSDWGKKLTIEAPPADQITDSGSLGL